MEREEVRAYDNACCKLRDMQFAAHEFYARQHALTAKELFMLNILRFAPKFLARFWLFFCLSQHLSAIS